MTDPTLPVTKEELDNLKEIRRYGIEDLEKYLVKIKKNISVFDEAIAKETKKCAGSKT